jgi:plasmid stability protein
MITVISTQLTGTEMASITIRKLEEPLKGKLRMRAAQHGRSMEEEVRHILRAVLAEKVPAPTNLFEEIRRHVARSGGVDLKIPRRRSMREPPPFDE